MFRICRHLFRSGLWGAIVPVVFLVFWGAQAQAGLILGVTDKFESGAANWTNGIAADPIVVAGGKDGPNDHFLQVHSTGSGGAGSKLITFNTTQWKGDYTGVTSISMDFKNLGASALSMRLALKNGTSSTSPGYVSTTAFSLPVDSNWHHAVFSFDSASFTKIGAASAWSTFLTNPAEFRILSEAAHPPTSLDGDTILATVGIDNITAVPEPAALTLLAAGGLCLLAWRWRKAR